VLFDSSVPIPYRPQGEQHPLLDSLTPLPAATWFSQVSHPGTNQAQSAPSLRLQGDMAAG